MNVDKISALFKKKVCYILENSSLFDKNLSIPSELSQVTHLKTQEFKLHGDSPQKSVHPVHTQFPICTVFS